jgi:hypothetical protein
MSSSKLNEHVILLDTGANRDAVLEAIEAAGGQITHRVSRTAWIINLDRPEADVAKVLPAGARLLRDQDALPAGLPKSEAMQLRALRLRRTAKYRQSKLHRQHEGKEWGKDGLDEPDAPDDMATPVVVVGIAGAGATIPSNERLINDVAVGVVIVNGHGQYAISEEGKDQIVAEVQEGLTYFFKNGGSTAPTFASPTWTRASTQAMRTEYRSA